MKNNLCSQSNVCVEKMFGPPACVCVLADCLRVRHPLGPSKVKRKSVRERAMSTDAHERASFLSFNPSSAGYGQGN